MASGIELWQLRGAGRQEALARARAQLAAWGVAVPDVEPLVLDFSLGRFYQTGLIEYWIANEIDAGYCGKYLFVFDGQRCPAHRHQAKHETFFLVKGRLEVMLDGRQRILAEADRLAIPPGRLHWFGGLGPALLLELSMPCIISDNQFQDPAVADWLTRFAS